MSPLLAGSCDSSSAHDSDNLVFKSGRGNRSGSSNSDSVDLMTPLTTPIFDFH